MQKLLYKGRVYKRALSNTGYDSVSYHSEQEMKGLRPSPLYGVISITDPGRTANLPEGWGSILRLQFDDVEEPDPYKPYGDPYARSSDLFTTQDAQKIIQWLNANKRELAGVYVHCWGGVSRSAAVAKFIAEKYGIPFDHSYDKYNTLVYDLLKQEDGNAATSRTAASYSSDTLFLAKSVHTPKDWCYDHIGFVDKATGNFVQMSGHRHKEGVFSLSKLTDEPTIQSDHYDTIKLPKTVTFTRNPLGAVNCVTFVVAVLNANGIDRWDREDFHRIFKCDKSTTASSNKTTIRYKGATYRRAYADDYLYHITYVGSLPAIAARGLHPGTGVTFGKGYSGYSAGKLFLSEWDGVGFWVDRLGAMAENRADNPVQDGLIPIVIRVPDGIVPDVEEDTPGTHDSNAGAWTTTQPIPPSQLEVYDGASWLPLSSVDHEMLTEEAYEAAEKEFEDDEELVYLNASQFEPTFS